MSGTTTTTSSVTTQPNFLPELDAGSGMTYMDINKAAKLGVQVENYDEIVKDNGGKATGIGDGFRPSYVVVSKNEQGQWANPYKDKTMFMRMDNGNTIFTPINYDFDEEGKKTNYSFNTNTLVMSKSNSGSWDGQWYDNKRSGRIPKEFNVNGETINNMKVRWNPTANNYESFVPYESSQDFEQSIAINSKYNSFGGFMTQGAGMDLFNNQNKNLRWQPVTNDYQPIQNFRPPQNNEFCNTMDCIIQSLMSTN